MHGKAATLALHFALALACPDVRVRKHTPLSANTSPKAKPMIWSVYQW